MSDPEKRSDFDPIPTVAGTIKGVKNLANVTTGTAVSSVRLLGRAVRSTLSLGLGEGPSSSIPQAKPGDGAGIENAPDANTPPEPGKIGITVIDYSEEKLESTTFDTVDALLGAKRPEWSKTRWINIDGLHPYIIKKISDHYSIHTLAAEDVYHVPQRPKLENFPQHLFVVTRMLTLEDNVLANEQVSFFLFNDVLITFQERPGDVFAPVRMRMETSGSRIRRHSADHLLYALLDAIVDHLFPILENYGDRLEALEQLALTSTANTVQQSIFRIKGELSLLRRTMWPLREILDQLTRSEETELLSDYTKNFMRDVYDHAIQVIDLVETYREMAGGLHDLYMSTVSNKMNEIMKILTIMTALFVPTTFFAGIYGMNFEHMPELGFEYSYPVFWIVIISMFVGMILFFYKKGWIGKGP